MKERLVVDTNVFVDWLFDVLDVNASSHVLLNLDKNNSRLVFSQDTIGELMYIMKKSCNRVNSTAEESLNVLTFISNLFLSAKSVNTKEIQKDDQRPLCNDETDQMFIDAALVSEAPYLISLDKNSGMFDIEGQSFVCLLPEDYLSFKNTQIKAAYGHEDHQG